MIKKKKKKKVSREYDGEKRSPMGVQGLRSSVRSEKPP